MESQIKETMETNFSVLMAVYHKEAPVFLYQSMSSIFAQTVKTNDFVLVCDGPLTPELDSIIEKMCMDHPNILNVIRLKENKGLGNALNTGIQQCKNELIARMDSDDIAISDRCEKQMNIFLNHPEIDICSGTVLEFNGSTDNITAVKSLPETNEKIIQFSKKRNPFNHPCVMVKKSAVEQAGGYQDCFLLEDYFLWVRMLSCGKKGYNIQTPLLYMRVGSELYKRRGGLKYAKSQNKLFAKMYDIGYINRFEEFQSIAIRCSISLLPNCLRGIFFKVLRVLRCDGQSFEKNACSIK